MQPTDEQGQQSTRDLKPGANFGQHVVALIDLLGQSSELAKWDFVPTSNSEMERWLTAVKSSMGRVIQWREEFEKQLARYFQTLAKYDDVFVEKAGGWHGQADAPSSAKLPTRLPASAWPCLCRCVFVRAKARPSGRDVALLCA